MKPVFRPAYTDSNGNVSYGSPIVIDDWKNEFYIKKVSGTWTMFDFDQDAYICVKSKRYSVDMGRTESGQTSTSTSSSHNNTNYYCVFCRDEKYTGTYFGSQWSTVNNPDEVGKVYLEEDFKKILWYYRPYATHSCDEAYVTMSETIWNCEAEKEAVTNTMIIENKILGKIQIIINHNGSEQNKIEIPVYLEKRACNKDL